MNVLDSSVFDIDTSLGLPSLVIADSKVSQKTILKKLLDTGFEPVQSHLDVIALLKEKKGAKIVYVESGKHLNERIEAVLIQYPDGLISLADTEKGILSSVSFDTHKIHLVVVMASSQMEASASGLLEYFGVKESFA